MPVWGELELAWRLRPAQGAAPWLVVTGTNGKTTTTLMLESMLRAAGLRTVAAGNIGVSMVDVVMAEATPEGALDAIAVEVGAPQLPFLHSMSPQASVCLNIAEDHVDLFGSFEAYVAAKARIYARTQVAAVYNVADDVTRRMVEDADVVEGCRAIGFTLGIPDISMLGVVEEFLVDRAFVPDRQRAAQELASTADVRPVGPAQRRQRPGGSRAGPGPRRRRVGDPRRIARVRASRPPHRRRRHGGRGPVRRRLQGHELPRGADLADGL